MSQPSRSARLYLLFIFISFGVLGFIFAEMEADVAVSLEGESRRGQGNDAIRIEVGGLISEVFVSEGDHIQVDMPILRLDDTEVRDQIRSLDAEIMGAKAVIESKRTTQKIYQKEVVAVERLVKKGLEPNSAARKARVDLGLAEAGLIEAEGKLKVLESRKAQYADRLDRYVLKSQSAGKLLRLHRFSRGDVVQAGDLIGDLVPDEGELVYEAKVKPSDIASVVVGNEAKITLRASNRYEIKPKYGKVVYVSPSSITPNEGEPYFVARVKLNEEELIGDAGMFAEVGHMVDISVKSGKRSVLAFIMSPLVKGAERAMQEQ